MRVVWLTDVHLDYVASPITFVRFLEKVHARSPEAVVITGDIATSDTFRTLVGLYTEAIKVPTYFVLGNHDLWGAKKEVTYRRVRDMLTPTLVWLQEVPGVALTPGTTLIGVDGWYDRRAGDWDVTQFRMHDPKAIHDYHRIGRDAEFAMDQRMADKATDKLIERIHRAVAGGCKNLLLATHIPPFAELCEFRGRPTDADVIPFYCNLRMGQELVAVARQYREVTFTLLCGHTHGAKEYSPLPNLHCKVGASRGGHPAPQPDLIVP